MNVCGMGEFFQSVESSHFSNKIEQDLHNFENDSHRMMGSSSQNKKIKLKALVSCLLRVDVWATLHSTFSNDIQHTVITLESAAKNKIEIEKERARAREKDNESSMCNKISLRY